MSTYLLPYITGTVATTSGSSTVTGTLTAWLSQVQPGDNFRIGSASAIVASVDSNTQITLLTTWGTTATGQSYAIDRWSQGHSAPGTLALRNSQLLESLGTGYTMQSPTSLAIGVGSKAFDVAAGVPILPGARMIVASRADLANAMWGTVTSYSGTTIVLNVEAVSGSGTFADWNINIAGDRGLTGSTGATGAQGTPGELTRSGAVAAGNLAAWVSNTQVRAATPADMQSIPQSLMLNMLEDSGRFGGTPDPVAITIGSYVAPTYLVAYNGSALAAGDKFIHNNSTYGGTAGALGADVDALIQKLKSDAAGNIYRRYGNEFYVINVTAGSGTASSIVANSVTHYLAIANTQGPFWDKSTAIYNVRCNSGSIALAFSTVIDTYIDGVMMTANTQIVPADGWKQVLRRYRQDPRASVGYEVSAFRFYATAGAAVRFACPIILPGQVYPLDPFVPYTPVPGVRMWR